jgi:hypothetical protein
LVTCVAPLSVCPRHGAPNPCLSRSGVPSARFHGPWFPGSAQADRRSSPLPEGQLAHPAHPWPKRGHAAGQREPPQLRFIKLRARQDNERPDGSLCQPRQSETTAGSGGVGCDHQPDNHPCLPQQPTFWPVNRGRQGDDPCGEEPAPQRSSPSRLTVQGIMPEDAAPNAFASTGTEWTERAHSLQSSVTGHPVGGPERALIRKQVPASPAWHDGHRGRVRPPSRACPRSASRTRMLTNSFLSHAALPPRSRTELNWSNGVN